MAYQLVPQFAVAQPINEVSTMQKLPLGTIVRIQDPLINVTFGGAMGEAIYLRVSGTSVVVGSMVDYDPYLGTAVLSPATAGEGSVAVSFNIVPATNFAWFQITGAAAVKAPNAMVVGAGVWSLAATAGSVDDAAVAGEQIVNCKVSSTTPTPATGLGYIELNRSFHQGAIV